ncbi:acyl-CoA synthetase [Nocardia puris]|uniref:Fatty-acyl-CoA synthase n=1 Tax=Nocardia puris TaxID=208602 RepID=A0A366E2B6_9NOCA|nr:acyl-CoA synthetase [Nocardia puris]MBF6212706.1 acyl-CoA synthetase [Nocardia puris]MBF6367644.1 acyl-CoA synthetase [Nocardia puris]MBF6461295.1 acyl-CoA synthetase [Nocardia puris]RBO96473.1 fatty-acyl-CoA synthase [Nocardia puris]
MKRVSAIATGAARRIADETYYASLAVRAGLVTPERPDRLVHMGAAVARFGTLGGLVTFAALRYRDRAALIDERGAVTFRELDERSSALANAWRARGLRDGEGVAILARNHRGFHYALFAAAKCGARVILLNTDFAGPQLREVAEREGADLLVHDDEYTGILGDLRTRRGRFRAWTDAPAVDSLDNLIAAGARTPPRRPATTAKIVLLTSGTTGTPKGAARREPLSLAPLGAILSRIPFRAREVTECPAPLFHTLGFAHAIMALGFGSTLVVRRRFDPAEVLRSLHTHRATALVAVPAMLRRIVDLGPQARAGLDFSRLRIIVVAGSQLGAELCVRVTEAFGPVVHNLYGSTEVAYATIATPADLAVEPGCVGRPVPSATVKIFDDHDRELPRGRTGRIFVGNDFRFDGYTGGGDKTRLGRLIATGDLGHFDSAGRLFVEGREDDMIVSGGENVFPGEVEELLAAHPAIEEVCAFGVDDERHGQRLRAVVVVRPGHSLTADDVRDHVRSHLARFKVPRDVRFAEALPRNPTGKVLVRVLREQP